MTLAPIYADAEGALLAWAVAHPTLTGRGNPLAAGLHINEVRSPAEGAIGYFEVSADRSTDDVADVPRVSFEIRSRSRSVAERAARGLAEALAALTTAPPTVTTVRGDRVRILGAGDVTGPIYAGDLSGEHAYRLDATIPMLPL